jgi:hypothetical protein
LWAPDSWLPAAWAPDSERSQLSLGRAIELFLAAKGAEGASPKTLQWYRMVLGRAARDLGADRALDALTGPQLHDWLLTLRETLAPISVAGYVRGCKVLGNWCAAEELAEAKALRALRRPKVPHKLVISSGSSAPTSSSCGSPDRRMVARRSLASAVLIWSTQQQVRTSSAVGRYRPSSSNAKVPTCSKAAARSMGLGRPSSSSPPSAR